MTVDSRRPLTVTEAVEARKSFRAFRPDRIDPATIRQLLTTASRAPSGGNVQPWRIYVLVDEALAEFRRFVAERPGEEPEYDVYPPKLWEPYRTNRFTLGEAMYSTIGIAHDDRAGRLAQFARNRNFFGAPAAFFCFIDRGMGRPQWSDLGMFLQTFMLLAQEAGIDTCPQEYWADHPRAVSEFVGAPDDEMLFCGMAIGYADTEHPINSLHSERMPLDDWCRFVESP